MRPEDSFLERLTERDRRDSEITPGTLDGHFGVLYQSPGEALRETRNRTVHGFIHCLGELPERVPFVLGSLRPPRRRFNSVPGHHVFNHLHRPATLFLFPSVPKKFADAPGFASILVRWADGLLSFNTSGGIEFFQVFQT